MEQRIELHVAANASGEILAIGLAERTDTGCSVLVAARP
jgi:hypothetical protein